MSRTLLNVVVDLLAALAILTLIVTGILMHFVMPAGTGHSLTLWGWDRHQWGDLHFWIALSTVSLLVLHVALHWTWIISLARRLKGGADNVATGLRTKAIAAVVTVAVLGGAIAGFWHVAMSQVQETGRGGDGAGRGGPARSASTTRPGDAQVRGFMTLEEVSAAAGLPLEVVKQRLELPASVSGQDRLGQLTRRYGLTMAQARERLGMPGQEPE